MLRTASIPPFSLARLQASASIPEEGVVLAGLSPTGAYLVTCTRPGGKAEDGSTAKNLKVSSGGSSKWGAGTGTGAGDRRVGEVWSRPGGQATGAVAAAAQHHTGKKRQRLWWVGHAWPSAA